MDAYLTPHASAGGLEATQLAWRAIGCACPQASATEEVTNGDGAIDCNLCIL